ncbi:hypothetical protein ACIBHX_26085 [Nonomuraea sp. NPDC050536]|uniref:hypothetical protein n=1 Tax=Nonomuraea sp. NPDC050536 TaxID=3364366 RepID=UPI0037C5940E
MRGRIPLLVAIEAVLTTLLAIMINVATGGTLPSLLEPYRGLAWPAVALLGLAMVVVPLWRLALDRVLTGARRSYGAYHQDQQRRRVLELLAARWEAAPALPSIALDLEPRPDAVVPPADLLLRPPEPVEVRGGDIRHAWELMDRSLLILGAPGAGKSTELLGLAHRLLADC